MRRPLLALALATLPFAAQAHHGQDFLLVESPTVPHPGSAYLLANAQVALGDGADEDAMFSPALLFGLSPRFAFELHAHVVKPAGDGWTYEATAPSVHWRLTDPARHDGLQVGLSLEYEIAREAEAPDNTELRLSLERASGRGKWAANLIASHEQGGESDLGASLGYRHAVDDALALGVEWEGSFEHAAGATLLAGGYFEFNEACTLKLGLGGERDDTGRVQPVARLGLVLALR